MLRKCNAKFAHTATHSNKVRRKSFSFQLELVTSSNMSDRNCWWLDVGMSSDVKNSGKMQIWLGDLVHRLPMGMKIVERMWTVTNSTHCFSVISYDMMQIDTGEFYIQTPNLSPEYLIFAARKLILNLICARDLLGSLSRHQCIT